MRAPASALCAAAAALVLLAPAVATAADANAELPGALTRQSASSAPGSTDPGEVKEPSTGGRELSLTRAQAIRIARSDPKVMAEEESRGHLEVVTESKPPDTWQIGFRDGDDEVVQVLVDDPTGTVRESWTGYQVEWQMARGYEGSFGHKLNAPYVWIPLAIVFLFGLLDWRRPLKTVHLDLLVLLGFGISQIYFNRAEIGVSVPLVYPVLVYLFGRALWIGFRGVAGGGLSPSAPATWLATAAVFLLAFRIAVNIADSGVIDVGYAGVIGADHLTHLDPIWGKDVFPTENPFGDTYGPVNYLFYVPFELVLPWSGSWDTLPAAHAAAIFFDLATLAGLVLVARRLRRGEPGNELAAVLAFAWVAYPYTDYVLQSNSNDSLVGALLIWSLVFFARPIARGGLLAAASLTKFAPLALAPLLAVGRRGLAARPLRPALPGLLLFAAGFAAVAAVLLAIPAIDSGLGTFYDRTVAEQIDRSSPFSIWGQTDLDWLQTVIRFGVVALGVLVAFVPKRRSLPQVAALAAAILIAVQITADHWFYLYIVWFLPLLLIALTTEEEREQAPAQSSPPAHPLAG